MKLSHLLIFILNNTMCYGYGVNPIAAKMNQLFVLNSLYSAGKSRYTADQGRAAENWIQVSLTGKELSAWGS